MPTTIRDYTTADAIRPATAEEARRYAFHLTSLTASQREIGAVGGDVVADDLDGRTVYLEGEIPTLYPVYTVHADRQTGEWLGEAEPTGEWMTLVEWYAAPDDEDTHRDHYTGWGEDMRLLRMTWVD